MKKFKSYILIANLNWLQFCFVVTIEKYAG